MTNVGYRDISHDMFFFVLFFSTFLNIRYARQMNLTLLKKKYDDIITNIFNYFQNSNKLPKSTIIYTINISYKYNIEIKEDI